MTNQEYFNSLSERATHGALTALESVWLDDYQTHIDALTNDEREAFNSAEIEKPHSQTVKLIDAFFATHQRRGYATTEILRELIMTIDNVNDRFDAIDYAANQYGIVV